MRDLHLCVRSRLVRLLSALTQVRKLLGTLLLRLTRSCLRSVLTPTLLLRSLLGLGQLQKRFKGSVSPDNPLLKAVRAWSMLVLLNEARSALNSVKATLIFSASGTPTPKEVKRLPKVPAASSAACLLKPKEVTLLSAQSFTTSALFLNTASTLLMLSSKVACCLETFSRKLGDLSCPESCGKCDPKTLCDLSKSSKLFVGLLDASPFIWSVSAKKL